VEREGDVGSKIGGHGEQEAPPALERRGAAAPDDQRSADRALVARLRVHDEAAYREFFLRHRPLLLELARRGRVRPELRDEIAGDFLERISMKLARPTSVVPDHLAAYVAAAFTRHLIDRARARRSRSAALREAMTARDSGEWVVSSLSSEDALRASVGAGGRDDGELPAALRALLGFVESETSEEERRLLWWLAERVPQRQIAEWTGVSHGAARLRVMRLRAKLRQRILTYVAGQPPDERAAVLRVLGRAATEAEASSGRVTAGRESDA